MVFRRLALGTAVITLIVVVGATCALPDAFAPAAIPDIAIEFESDTVIVLGEAMRPVAQVTSDGEVLTDVNIRITSSDPSIVQVSADGAVITGRQLGQAILTAQATGSMLASPAPSAQLVLTVVPKSASIEPGTAGFTSVGQVMTLSFTAFDALGQVIPNVTPAWRSSDTSKIRVDFRGVATAKAETTTPVIISAHVLGFSTSVEASVVDLPVTLSLQPATLSIPAPGVTRTLSVSAYNALGAPTTGTAIEWRVSDPSVATLSGSGTMRTVAAVGVGIADVEVTAGSLIATSRVTVTNSPTVIRIEPDTVRLSYPGATSLPPAVFLNATGDTLSRESAAWSIDDPAVGRVARDGAITARDAGATIVRAVSEHTSDSLVLIVTNDPETVAIDAVLDTLPGLGQSLTYRATVRNAVGVVMSYPLAWSSSNEAIARVTEEGDGVRVTAVGLGAASIVADAGEVADTLFIVVRNPTRIHVDNGAFIAQRNGTRTRPFARIQDAVAIADPFDTVLVSRGAFPYAETVSLTRRITLMGDAPAFEPANPDPELLPVIAHDTGSAAILAFTSAPEVIRYFTIRHTIDGPAIHGRGADIEIEHVYVNPGETARIGRGILIENGTTGAAARVRRSVVQSVRGYGIQLADVTGGRISQVIVDGVDSIPGTRGQGIVVASSAGTTLDTVTVRRAAGPHIHISRGSSAIVRAADLSGRNRLIVMDTVTGNSSITGSFFLLDRPSGDPVASTSDDDGRAAIELRDSRGITISGVGFRENGNAMDAIRVIGSRGAIGTPSISSAGLSLAGTIVSNVTFVGGRYHVRSERSTILVEGIASDSARLAMRLENEDTLALLDSDVRRAPRCVAAEGLNPRLFVSGSTLVRCGTAIDVAATGRLYIDSSRVARNAMGVRVGAGGSMTAVENDWYDNDTAAVAIAGDVTAALDNNFWGDARGPRRSTDPSATGDSLIAPSLIVVADSVPLLRGTTASALRAVRGQSAPRTSTAYATVRVVDVSGLPVANVPVVFTCTSIGCGTGSLPRLQPAAGFSTTGTTAERTVMTRGDGLAEVGVELRGIVGGVSITAATGGATPVTLTVTGQ